LTYGSWPDGSLDHRNGCRYDNRIENLRLCDDASNQWNSKPRGGRKFKGVTMLRNGKYQAVCGKSYLGLFESAEAAALAYDEVAAKRYGEFARLNFTEVAA
jgi:hypothetical protein